MTYRYGLDDPTDRSRRVACPPAVTILLPGNDTDKVVLEALKRKKEFAQTFG